MVLLLPLEVLLVALDPAADDCAPVVSLSEGELDGQALFRAADGEL